MFSFFLFSFLFNFYCISPLPFIPYSPPPLPAITTLLSMSMSPFSFTNYHHPCLLPQDSKLLQGKVLKIISSYVGTSPSQQSTRGSQLLLILPPSFSSSQYSPETQDSINGGLAVMETRSHFPLDPFPGAQQIQNSVPTLFSEANQYGLII